MAAGVFIVAVCAFGGVIACGAFWWAMRSGQLADVAAAQYLVFDEEDDPALAERARACTLPPVPPPPPPPA
jgi:cbb3-type cytochrome oxidase maturation protein